MLKEINLTKLIEHYYSVTKDSEPRVYGSFQATKTMLFEFGQQLLELAAENAIASPVYDRDILTDSCVVDKQSILDTIKQVK